MATKKYRGVDRVGSFGSRTQAWAKFLEQWLVKGTGGGYAEYRRILKEDGVYYLVYLWKLFVVYQYWYGYLNQDQYNKWMVYPPKELQNIINRRKCAGWPTGKPMGNPSFVEGNTVKRDAMVKNGWTPPTEEEIYIRNKMRKPAYVVSTLAEWGELIQYGDVIIARKYSNEWNERNCIIGRRINVRGRENRKYVMKTCTIKGYTKQNGIEIENEDIRWYIEKKYGTLDVEMACLLVREI